MKNILEVLILASLCMGMFSAENIPICISCFVLCGALTALYLRIREEE